MSHGGGGGPGLKSAEKVSRIIWMAPKYNNQMRLFHFNQL